MLNKAKNIFFALIAMSVIFVGCEETTDTVEKPLPAAPTNLQATSINETTVNIKFDASSDNDSTGFVGYEIEIIDAAGNAVGTDTLTAQASASGYLTSISNLEEGKVYSFNVSSMNDNGKSEAATVKWSPAFRLNTTINNVAIKVYGSKSQYGSGLKIYSEDEFGDKGPEVLTVAKKAMWNLAFDDTQSKIRFGSADAVSVGANSDNPTNPAQISNKLYDVTSLDEVFDSQALSQGSFTSNLIDLGSSVYTSNKGIVLVFRIKNDDNTYNYGKILIKKDATDGNFVFNDGQDDNYLDCVISYQRTSDVPYAKIGF